MSDIHSDGTPRIYKTIRIQLNINTVQRLSELESPPTLSSVLNDLLNDYVTNQELKQLLSSRFTEPANKRL